MVLGNIFEFHVKMFTSSVVTCDLLLDHRCTNYYDGTFSNNFIF